MTSLEQQAGTGLLLVIKETLPTPTALQSWIGSYRESEKNNSGETTMVGCTDKPLGIMCIQKRGLHIGYTSKRSAFSSA